jgi:hypothetical protein
MKKFICLSMLLLSVNFSVMAKPSVARTQEAGPIAEATNHVVSGDASVLLPALPGTESIALYRVRAYPEAVFSLKTPQQGITISPDGRLVVETTASPGEIVLEAEVEKGQKIQKSVRLEIYSHGDGTNIIRPESVPEVKLPAYLPGAETYPALRYALLALSFLPFAIYVYGRHRGSKALTAGK